MKKTFLTEFSTLLMLLFAFLSCSTESVSIPIEDEGPLTVSQAMECYEAAFPDTRNNTRSDPYLSVGFTPLWDGAAYSCSESLESLDVPVEKDVHFRVRRGRDYVSSPQRLTVIKDIASGYGFYYLTTFIPNPNFLKTIDSSEYDPRLFETLGAKGNYSGLVVYTPVNSSEILVVNVFKNGKRVNGAHILSSNTLEKREGRKRIQQLLQGYHVYKIE